MSEKSKLDYRSYTRSFKDFPVASVDFVDVSPLVGDGKVFSQLVQDMAEPHRDRVSKVVGFDARGFLFAGAIATELEVGCVMMRKAGKLPGTVHQVSYDLEYGSNTLEIQSDSLEIGDRVLLVDDVIATGGTALAGIELVRKCGGEVIEFCSVIDLPGLKGSSKITDAGVAVRSMIELGE